MKAGQRRRTPDFYKLNYPEIIRLRKRGWSYQRIGEVLSPPTSRQAVHYICKQAGLTNGARR